jgi:hypothetical protein
VAYDTLTVNPDAHTETTSVDGVALEYSAAGVAWATLKAGSGTAADDTGATNSVLIQSDDENDKWNYIYRRIFLFDTSSLTASATISAATESLYGTAKSNEITGGTWAYGIYSSAPASNTAIAAGDFDSLGTDIFSDTIITYASWGTTGYNDYVLNATGLAAISKTSITKTGKREVYYDASTGTPDNAAGTKTIVVTSNDSDNGSNKPKLVVTYISGAGGAFLYNLI